MKSVTPPPPPTHPLNLTFWYNNGTHSSSKQKKNVMLLYPNRKYSKELALSSSLLSGQRTVAHPYRFSCCALAVGINNPTHFHFQYSSNLLLIAMCRSSMYQVGNLFTFQFSFEKLWYQPLMKQTWCDYSNLAILFQSETV